MWVKSFLAKLARFSGNVLVLLMQATVMLGDVAIFGAIAMCLYCLFDFPLSIITIIALVMAWRSFKVWKSEGGFMAWTSSGRREFFNGMRKMGLWNWT